LPERGSMGSMTRRGNCRDNAPVHACVNIGERILSAKSKHPDLVCTP
jgi:hypothetical protein